MTTAAAALVVGGFVWASADLSPGFFAPGSEVSLLAPAGSRVQYAQGLDERRQAPQDRRRTPASSRSPKPT